MSPKPRLLTILAIAGALATAAPAQADPSAAGLCPQTTTSGMPAPQLSCVPEAVPGEGWTAAGIEPVTDPAKLSVYASILKPYSAYYAVPRDPALGFVGARLNTGSLSTSTADPGQGYQEMEVAIRVLETQTGEEGWFPLATSVNDSSEYTAGRLVGFPKFAADENITHDAASGDWTYTAWPQGKDTSPFQVYRFASASPGAVSAAQRAELSALDLYQDAMFTTARAWDENDPSWFPVRNKFTITPLVPFLDAVPVAPPGTGTPVDADISQPAPTLGTLRVNISQSVGPDSLKAFRGLLDTDKDGNATTSTMPGMFWHGNGWVFISSERLDGQPGLPGKYQAGPNYGLGGPPPPAVPQNVLSAPTAAGKVRHNQAKQHRRHR
jgi:hypothetical protein